MTLTGLAIAMLILGGSLPFVARVRRGRGPAVAAGAFSVALVASMALAWAALRIPVKAPFPEQGRPRLEAGPEHVTSQACQSCHPAEYDSWHRSYHRTMTQLATPEAVRGDFSGVRVELRDRAHVMQRRGDGFYVDDQRVMMTTGSHHMQAYWVPSAAGNLVELVQAVYLFDEQRWVPRKDVFLQPPRTQRRIDTWNGNCITCHATHGRPRLQQGPDTHVTEFGIACEACHGPAREHVATHRSPLERYARHFDGDEGDATVVNPARLSARRSSHVCARCHAISVFTTEADEEAYYNGDGDSFRPGDDLDLTGHVVRGLDDPRIAAEPAYLRDSMFWPDGVSRGSGREFNAMQQSACFGEGRRADNVSCLSCHRMHRRADDPRPMRQWANDQLAPQMDGDRACLQCHEEIASDLRGHTHHPVESAGSRCYNCHMPHTTYGLLKAIRSHYIASPDVARTVETGRPNACNLCHLDRPLGWTAEHLSAWYGQPAPSLDPEQRDVASSVRWLLTGDARQRVLLAWHAGWPPAHEASGKDWIAPFLAPLLADPYSVVRQVSARSMRTLPGFEDLELDPLAPLPELERSSRQVWQTWWSRPGSRRDPALLMGPTGLDDERLVGMLARRDDRAVGVTE